MATPHFLSDRFGSFLQGALQGTPKNLLRLFFRNNLARQKITSKIKITSRGYFYACFKGSLFGGSLKITSENKSNFKAKNSLKRFLGTNLRGQTECKRRFTQIFADLLADSRLLLENKAFGKRRFSQKTADFRRNPQKAAGTRRKPQIGVCPLRFVPLSADLFLLSHGKRVVATISAFISE